MPTTATCPNTACGSCLTVADAAVGRRVRCKACGHAFTLTAADDATLTVAPAGLPERVGRFVVRSQLGAGAFGVVYRAFDPHLEREVAVKVPNAAVLKDAKRVGRFVREAKAAARLRHPHIVPVFDTGRDGDTLYIASAFVDGKPLGDSIPDGGMPFADAARIVRELAEALAYAHAEGIVHRV